MKKVLAGGVFNSIHPGHRYFLERAKVLGDSLTVVIASDRTVLKSKRLLKPQEERKRMVEGLKIADKVIIGDEEDFLLVVKREKPDIVALGYDQVFDEEKLKSLGCRIVRIQKYGSYSTSRIVKGKK